MSRIELENCIIAIEAELAELKAKAAVPAGAHPVAALELIHGAFANDAAFKEAIELGKKWRRSDRRKPKADAK